VSAPNDAGITWNRGTTQTITWSYLGDIGSKVKIVLLKAGSEVGTINASTMAGASGAGSYTWPIGTTGLTGSDFKISVQSVSQPGVKDMSNNSFTIASATAPPTASITVSAPNDAGITWNRGTTQTITWSYLGDIGPSVKIVLLKSGVEVGTIIASTPAGSTGTGSYTWQIGTTGLNGGDFKISVQSISTSTIKDASDNFFTITAH
jgi:hypothetical protein